MLYNGVFAPTILHGRLAGNYNFGMFHLPFPICHGADGKVKKKDDIYSVFRILLTRRSLWSRRARIGRSLGPSSPGIILQVARTGVVRCHCGAGQVHRRFTATSAMQRKEMAMHNALDSDGGLRSVHSVLRFPRHIPMSASTILLVSLRPQRICHRHMQRKRPCHDPNVRLLRHQCGI